MQRGSFCVIYLRETALLHMWAGIYKGRYGFTTMHKYHGINNAQQRSGRNSPDTVSFSVFPPIWAIDNTRAWSSRQSRVSGKSYCRWLHPSEINTM